MKVLGHENGYLIIEISAAFATGYHVYKKVETKVEGIIYKRMNPTLHWFDSEKAAREWANKLPAMEG